MLRSAIPVAVLLLTGCATSPYSDLGRADLNRSAVESLEQPARAGRALSMAECNAAGGAQFCAAGSRIARDRACTCVSREVLQSDRAWIQGAGAY